MDSQNISKESGIFTGSNFFNASQDQLNNLATQVEKTSQPEVLSGDVLEQGKKKSLNHSLCGKVTGGKIIEQRQRYGNHRNKTTRGFERANIEGALKEKNKESNRYYKGAQAPWMPAQHYFTMFSPGIFLFFSFLKKVSILFALLTFVYMFPLLYNYLNGGGFQYAASTFQTAIARMTVGNQHNNGSAQENTIDKLFIMLPDSIGVALFLGFCIYWSKYCANIREEFKVKLKRASDYTVQVTDFPSYLSQGEAQKFFSKYGPISEVAAAKNYEQMIDLSKEVYELSLEIKQKILSHTGQVTESHAKYLAKNQKKVSELLEQLARIEQHREKKNIKFYIKFQEESSKKQVLNDYQPYYRFCSCLGQKVPPELKIEGHLPLIKSCETEPGEIVWQNIHIKRKSRWGRFIIQCALILVIITVGFVFISALNISTPPTSYSEIETSKLTLDDVQTMNTYSISYTWCLSKSSYTQQQLSFCLSYKQSYNHRLLLSIAITIIIIVTKTILKQIMIRIAYFQRYKNQTELSTNVMTNLFVIYISTTVMITFLLQANIFGISFKNFVQIFIKNAQLLENLSYFKEYYDFEPHWYKDIGYQIWMNWLILSVFPHTLLPLYYAVKQKIGFKMAQRQVLQKNVLKWIQAQEFQIEDHYANILLLIFVGFIFAGGIPFMIPLTLVALVSRYFILKLIFIRFCRIPKYYTDAMNERAKFILQLGLVLHVSISIWMFGVSAIFGDYDRISIFSTDNEGGLAVVARKLTAHWYLSCLLAVVVVCLIFHNIIISIVWALLRRETKEQNGVGSNQNEDMKVTQVALTESYKIEKNPNYFEILAIMKPEEINNTHLTQLFPYFNLAESTKPK